MTNVSLSEQERDFLLAAIDTVFAVGVQASPTPQQSALDQVARNVQLALEIREKLDPQQQDAPAPTVKTSVRNAVPPVVPARTLGSLAQQKTPPQADGVRYARADD